VNTLDYLAQKYNLDISKRSPIEIPNVGRNNLPVWFRDLGFTVGAEVGVLAGKFSKVLTYKDPKLHLYAVDAWKVYPGYKLFDFDQKVFDDYYEEAKQRLSGRNVTFVHKLSMDAIEDFEDESLDFVYVDANHEFMNVVQDITCWTRKVKKGGIVAGHDYKKARTTPGMHSVVEAIWGYTEAYHIRPWFILGAKAKVEGWIRDSSRSWLFVRS
jgi:hypothetical protein